MDIAVSQVFFRLSIHALLAKIQPHIVVRWCPDGAFFEMRPIFQRVACSTFQTRILNSHQGHIMCGSMVDIRYATAENRRGKRR